MRRVVLVTAHYFESKRKAGFHWLADAYWRDGWEVFFFTGYISWLSWLYRDYRFAYPIFQEAGKVRKIKERLASYVWLTPWHPAHLRSNFLNHIVGHWYWHYGDLPLGEIEPYLKDASLFIIDSTSVLLLFDRFKRLNPLARYVYRVSDDLRYCRMHPVASQAEESYAPRFDLVSVPSEALLRKFANLSTARLHPHGLNKDLFDRPYQNPYPHKVVNVVFVGTLLDLDFLERASRLFPEWCFHIVGPVSGLPERSNVIAYGELPFSQTIPYIKFADIGIWALNYETGREAGNNSLKIIQYTYCRLPIVVPEFLRSGRSNMFYYRAGDDASIRDAFLKAAKCDRTAISTTDIASWDDVARALSGIQNG